jgi:hypothetical protein
VLDQPRACGFPGASRIVTRGDGGTGTAPGSHDLQTKCSVSG